LLVQFIGAELLDKISTLLYTHIQLIF